MQADYVCSSSGVRIMWNHRSNMAVKVSVNKSAREVIITEHNGVVLPFLEIQNGEKKHVWLPSCGFDNGYGYA